MFERFTDRARTVVVLAQEEARLLNHNYIGTEHILLGLIQQGEGVAVQALASLDISLEDVRAQVEEIIGHGGEEPSGHIPFTPRAKKVLERSLREALQLGHNYIGTEHILLGLLREGEGVAAQVLDRLGADVSRVRQEVILLLSGVGGATTMTLSVSEPHESGRTAFARAGVFASQSASPHCSFCNRDLWEVDHYVAGRSATMCDACIEAAHIALEAATDDRQLLTLPPRVFGSPPADDPHAIEKITHALTAVFGPDLGDEAVAHLEDGEQLVPILLAQRERYPDIHVSEVVVDRVRFSTPVAASVGYTLVLNSAQRFGFVGAVVRVGERWLVTRTTVADVLATGGVRLPPRA